MVRKKVRFNRKFITLFLISSFCLPVLLANIAFAENKDIVSMGGNTFNKDINYDVYYEVSKFEVDCVLNVKVIGTIKIDSTTFLVVSGSEFSTKDKLGYILFSSVRAILPGQYVKPIRTFDPKSQ